MELTIYSWMWLYSCPVLVLWYYMLREQEKYIWSLDEVHHIHCWMMIGHHFQNTNYPGKHEHNTQRVKNYREKMTATSNTKWKHLRYMDCSMCLTWWMQRGQMPLKYICLFLSCFLTWLQILDLSVDNQVCYPSAGDLSSFRSLYSIEW